MSGPLVGRDHERQQVYTAEDLSGEHTVLVDPREIVELRQILGQLQAQPWWTGNFSAEPITLVANRSTQQSSFDPVQRRISLSPAATDLNTLAHEVTHAAVHDRNYREAPHGPRFRALHVMVRAAILGPESGVDLAEQYRRFGLALGRLPGVETPGESVFNEAVYRNQHIAGWPGMNTPAHRGPIAL